MGTLEKETESQLKISHVGGQGDYTHFQCVNSHTLTLWSNTKGYTEGKVDLTEQVQPGL